MTDPLMLDRAASCYLRVGDTAEAARCYREAGSYRRAADLYARMRRYSDAANAYADAGLFDLAAWILVHHTGDVAAARVYLARETRPVRAKAARASRAILLRRRLVLARCAVADGRPDLEALQAIEDVCAELERPEALADPYLEPWAVALSSAIRRDDQTALIFAAAVRGRRAGAAERWADWSREVLRCELILPVEQEESGVSGRVG